MKDEAAPDSSATTDDDLVSATQIKVSGSSEARKQPTCSLAGTCWIIHSCTRRSNLDGWWVAAVTTKRWTVPYIYPVLPWLCIQRWTNHEIKDAKKSPVTSLLVLCCIITKTGTLTFDILTVLHTALFRPVAPFSGRCSCGDLSSHELATCSQCDRSRMDIRKWK